MSSRRRWASRAQRQRRRPWLQVPSLVANLQVRCGSCEGVGGACVKQEEVGVKGSTVAAPAVAASAKPGQAASEVWKV